MPRPVIVQRSCKNYTDFPATLHKIHKEYSGEICRSLSSGEWYHVVSKVVQTFRRNMLPPAALLPWRWHSKFIRNTGDQLTRLHGIAIRKSKVSFRGQFRKVPYIKL